MRYGERLKKAMAFAEMTQQALADKAGIKQPSLSYLINEPNVTGSEFTVRLATACGVRAEWLDMEAGPMIDKYNIARDIAGKLDARERAAWYRAGRALAEHEEENSDKQ